MPFAALAALTLFAAQPAPEVELWRLDCGTIVSDAPADKGGWNFVNSCYLVRHGGDYLLWDAGLDGALAGGSTHDGWQRLALAETVKAQLARIGVTPDKLRFIGVSHYHFDHSSQAKDFPNATLLIGREDWELLRRSSDRRDRAGLLPWIEGGAKVDPVQGDRDVFGDGRVLMLAMPGHTPGHHALLVTLEDKRSVLLSGDQFHTRPAFEAGKLPGNNDDPVAAAASAARFRMLAEEGRATVIIQHEPEDIARLPIFPESAR